MSDLSNIRAALEAMLSNAKTKNEQVLTNQQDDDGYSKKYSTFFYNPVVNKIVSVALYIGDGSNLDRKYLNFQTDFINKRTNAFYNEYNAALKTGKITALSNFISELNELHSVNANIFKALVGNYLSIIDVEKINEINYKIALRCLDKLCDITNSGIHHYVQIINKLDDSDLESIADEFYEHAVARSPRNAWLRFREFRLRLGCHKNNDFVLMDDKKYRSFGEGTSIFNSADFQLKELFDLQSQNYEIRFEKERKRQAKKLEDEKRKRAQIEEYEKRRRAQIEEIKENAKKIAINCFKFLLLSMPLALSLLFMIGHILLMCRVSPFSDFWMSMYITIGKGSVIEVPRWREIAGIVTAGVFAVLQLLCLIFAMKDEDYFDFMDIEWHYLWSFIGTILGCVVICAISIAGGVYWNKAVKGEKLVVNARIYPYCKVYYYDGNFYNIGSGKHLSQVLNVYMCDGNDDTLIIPEELEGKSIIYNYDTVFLPKEMGKSRFVVQKIGDKNVLCTVTNKDMLTSIIIPENITSIRDYAFSGCSSLTSITISNSVTSIGDYAFSECSSLTSITIPNSVTSIGNGAFSECSSLTSITIPNSVTSMGQKVFSSCNSDLTVYCEAPYMQIGWDYLWSDGVSKIVWNCNNVSQIRRRRSYELYRVYQ